MHCCFETLKADLLEEYNGSEQNRVMGILKILIDGTFIHRG